MSARALLAKCLGAARRSQFCSEFVGREGHERPPFSSLPGRDGRAASFPLRPAGAERVRVRWGLPRSPAPGSWARGRLCCGVVVLRQAFADSVPAEGNDYCLISRMPPRCLEWVALLAPSSGVSRFGLEAVSPSRPESSQGAERSRGQGWPASSRATAPFARRAASLTAASTAPDSGRSGTSPRAVGRACYPLQTAKRHS